MDLNHRPPFTLFAVGALYAELLPQEWRELDTATSHHPATPPFLPIGLTDGHSVSP